MLNPRASSAAPRGSSRRPDPTSVFGVDLVEELVHQLEKTSADVEFVDPIEGLGELGDVAALLRW